ncbi:MAG: hypothetical protein AAF250_04135 [Pseudomonadota bacterium]
MKVEVEGGDQDGAQRDYAYDDADNRTQVVSVASTNAGSDDPSQLPPECALVGSEMPPLPDTDAAWPRVFVSAACDKSLQLSFTVEEVSGQGGWSPGVFLGYDSTLDSGPPDNETLKLASVVPVAGSVQTGTQLVLRVNWQVDNFIGAGTTAQSTVRIDGTGAGSGSGSDNCLLRPIDRTVTQNKSANPLAQAPKPDGCEYQIKLNYTITVVSGAINANQITSRFGGRDDTLEAGEASKRVFIGAVADEVSTSDPIVLQVNWSAPDGNADFEAPGYSVVTINPN